MGGASSSSKYTVTTTAENIDTPTTTPPRLQQNNTTTNRKNRRNNNTKRKLSPNTSKLKRWSTTTKINANPGQIFPQVHKDDRHRSNALPEWAVPKFKQWEKHILSKEEEEQKYHVNATLAHCKKFTNTHRRRLVHDKILTPRTLFSEIFTKPPAKISEHECYILETYVSDTQVRWDKEYEAALFVQRVWRGYQGSNAAHHAKKQFVLAKDRALADRRKLHDTKTMRKIVQDGEKSMEEHATLEKKKRELIQQEMMERQHQESFMVRFLASGGLHLPRKPTNDLGHDQHGQQQHRKGADNMSGMFLVVFFFREWIQTN
jgi:hypothetical protein